MFIRSGDHLQTRTQQSLVDRFVGGHLAVLNVELGYDAMDVVLDSANRDPELFSDLLIAEMSVRDQPQDLDLPACQPAVPLARDPTARLTEPSGLREQVVGDLGRAVIPTRHDDLDGLAKVV